MAETETDRLKHAVEGIHLQQMNRKHWAEGDTADAVAQMIVDESLELVQAIQESFLTGDVFSVASEIADILYLTHRLCAELGFDAADLIDMKTKRNSMKYSDAVLNNGYSPAEARRISKEAWLGMGGDPVFSHVYLNILADNADDSEEAV